MTGISVADHVRNPSGLFKDSFRAILHCVHSVCYLWLFKTLPLSRYSAGVFIFVPTYIHMISPQKEESSEGSQSTPAISSVSSLARDAPRCFRVVPALVIKSSSGEEFRN